MALGRYHHPMCYGFARLYELARPQGAKSTSMERGSQ